MDIQLNFINRSASNNSNIVIFQKNLAVRLESLAVAWRVIASSQGSTYPFTFSQGLEVSASDGLGDSTPMQPASGGQLFHIYQTPAGDELSYLGPAASKTGIQVRNDLPNGSMDANIYRAGKLLATKTGLAPRQQAVFRFNSTIWIGVVSQVVEGQIMDLTILSQVNRQISLLGINAANIILTGGGSGSSATPFKFRLQPQGKA